MTSADESKTSRDGPGQYKNAARASALSGRYHPKKYTSPLDTKNLITPGEFHRQFIKNGSKNPYTQRRPASEVPAPVNKLRQSLDSPVTPVTALSGTTQRSLTNSSVGGDTYHENDDNAPLGCFGFGHRHTKRSKEHGDSGSDEYVHSPKKLRRSLSWKSWFHMEK